ncbi:hypothetical protein ZWY2020_059016 [Hordeum vulgare]|nr:hypothetical protein ZWY2020_059016 [Hordeum vulgare]
MRRWRQPSDAFSQDYAATGALATASAAPEVHVGSKVLEVVGEQTRLSNTARIRILEKAGGPSYAVELGRLDRLSSTASSVPGKLAPPTSSLDQLTALFATNGLSHTDMIALSGTSAKTIHLSRDLHMSILEGRFLEFVRGFLRVQFLKGDVPKWVHNAMEDAKNVLSKMVDEGFQPDVETDKSIIVPLCESCKLEEARKIMEDMKMKGIVPTISTYHAFLKQEGIDETLQLLKKMKEDGCGPNSDTFLMLIDKFIQLNESGNALRVWTEMRRYDIRPGYAHYMAVVQETIGEEQADTILFHIVPNILQAGQEFRNTSVTVKGLLCTTEVNVNKCDCEVYNEWWSLVRSVGGAWASCGAYFAETEMALRCVEEVAHDGFTFSNGASLFAMKQALGSGCSYTPERGTFDIREHRECRDEYGYGYHGTHEQLGYGEEGGGKMSTGRVRQLARSAARCGCSSSPPSLPPRQRHCFLPSER